MKKIFDMPEIEIMLLGAQDVITTSDVVANDNGNDTANDEANDW